MRPRLRRKRPYDQSLPGAYGTFGSGGGVQVAYVQAAIPVSQLERISLVGEIEGSDRWPVRDLFQRDVDSERVERDLLPWLQDAEQVKFFNPLTLALVPVDPTSHAIPKEIPRLEESRFTDDAGDAWSELAHPDWYRFRWPLLDDAEYRENAWVDWSSGLVRLVAIDGQHRLSALKRYLRDTKGPGYDAFSRWSIPVVIGGLNRQSEAREWTGHTVLDVVRNIFVYINTQSRMPTRARQILLDDTDPVHICAQEVLQSFHHNDCLPPDERDDTVPPLSLFDWRGATRHGREIHSPIALKSVVELAAWLGHYVLGDQIDDEQRVALGVSESDELTKSYEEGHLLPGHHLLVRQRFRNNVLPGFNHLLQEFTPYRDYIAAVRGLERAAEHAGDAHRHALSLLRFGSHRGMSTDAATIQDRYDELIERILDAKSLPVLLGHDIGMRGVVYAFGALRDWHLEWTGTDAGGPWLPYAEWFVRNLNRMQADDWFGGGGHALRQYVTNMPGGEIINFKLDHAPRALGAFTVLVACTYAVAADDVLAASQFDEVWESFAAGEHSLHSTLRSGYRRRYMQEVAEKHPAWGLKRRREEAQTLANKAAIAHLRRFRKRLRELSGA